MQSTGGDPDSQGLSAGCLHAEEHEKIYFGQIILSVMV